MVRVVTTMVHRMLKDDIEAPQHHTIGMVTEDLFTMGYT